MRLPQACALALLPAVAGAQAFHGTLRTSARGAPVQGAIVVLEDSTRAIRASASSDEQGRFVLRLATAACVRLRIQRIGVRPYESIPFMLDGDTTAVIALNELPVSLPRVTSTAVSACHDRNFAAATVWETWEDVRTALIATSLTYAGQKNTFSLAQVKRVYETEPVALRDIALLENSVTATQPWTSLPPELLAQRGYVRFADDRLTFVSPDLEVLLSSSFENTHCFQPRLRHEGPLVGLAFEPARSLKNRTDIAGTFWLDAKSHELRRLTFEHTGLPLVLGDSLGESAVKFGKYGAQGWFISEWTIRAPVPELASSAETNPVRQLALFGDQIEGRIPGGLLWKLSAVNEQRGAVLSVTDSGEHDGGKTSWTAPTGSISVSVTSRSLAARAPPVEGAVVSLVGSSRQRVTGGAGTVTFDQLTDGDYRLSVNTLVNAQLIEPPVEIDAHVVAGALAAARVSLRTPNEIIRQRCGDTLQNVITGTVTYDGAPVPGATLAVFDTSGNGSGMRERAVGNFRPASADGRFVICTHRGATAGVLEVRARAKDGLQGSASAYFTNGNHYEAIELILRAPAEPKAPR